MSEQTVSFFGAEFWVMIAFAIFAVILFRLRVHKSVLSSIDQRAILIRGELEQAKSLREEAQRVLADYQRRHAEAETEAAGMIAAARGEAERLAADAKAKAEEFVIQRTKMAEAKITQAEAQAVADVRAAAADAAAAAAGIVLAGKMTGSVAEDLVEQGIARLKSRFQ